MNGILSQYIVRRFSNYIVGGTNKEGLFSKIRRMLEQKKTLADISLNLGFLNYIKASEKFLTMKRKMLLEDVFEAFIGAMVEVVDMKIKRGLGYMYAYNFVSKYLDDMEIELAQDTLNDPITILYELYKTNYFEDNRVPLKWGQVEYVKHKVAVPEIQDLPPSTKGYAEGAVIALERNKKVYFARGGSWESIKNVPAGFKLYFLPGGYENYWYNGVQGYLDNRGQPIPSSKLIGLNVQPSMIGQSVSLTTGEAKREAARNALQNLKDMGYVKKGV